MIAMPNADMLLSTGSDEHASPTCTDTCAADGKESMKDVQAEILKFETGAVIMEGLIQRAAQLKSEKRARLAELEAKEQRLAQEEQTSRESKEAEEVIEQEQRDVIAVKAEEDAALEVIFLLPECTPYVCRLACCDFRRLTTRRRRAGALELHSGGSW
jgi:hypothetical protein